MLVVAEVAEIEERTVGLVLEKDRKLEQWTFDKEHTEVATVAVVPADLLVLQRIAPRNLDLSLVATKFVKAGTDIAAGQVVGEVAGVVTRAAATVSAGVSAIGSGAETGAEAGKVDKRSEEPAEEGRFHTDHL